MRRLLDLKFSLPADQLDPETLDPFENPTGKLIIYKFIYTQLLIIIKFYYFIATELSSDQVDSPRHRPLEGKSRSIAKLRAEYQVGPTYDRYVCSPSNPMSLKDPEDENTLGIWTTMMCIIYDELTVSYDYSDQSHDKEGSEFADDFKGMVLQNHNYNAEGFLA